MPYAFRICVVMERIQIVGFVILFVGFVSGSTSKYSLPLIHNATSGREIIVNANEKLVLLCEGGENITWSYPNTDYLYQINVPRLSTFQSNGKYFSKLSLHNISYVDVGYYYCHAESDAKDDPKRSDKVYVYVRDEEHLSVRPADDIEFLIALENTSIILPCRPTTPDITVTLVDINEEEVNNSTYNVHLGYKVYTNIFDAQYSCKFIRNGIEEYLSIIVTVLARDTKYVAKPYIDAPNNGNTKVGTNSYVLNCSVTVERNVYFTLTWTTPNKPAEKTGRIHSTESIASDITDMKHGLSSLIIKDVQHQDAGEYSCMVTYHTLRTNSVSRNITVFDIEN